MDSVVQLALMSKAKKVFGADDTFLSFPVSPVFYTTKRQLDFFAQQDADALRQSQKNLLEFSKLINLIPSDEVWLPTETLFLWDVYEQVLKEGNFASSTRTPEEEAAYQKALAYLRIAIEGGAWEDSAPAKAYRQHKDAYLLTQQKYLADKSTAECATDPAEQQRWRDVDEPLQRAELDALQAQWIIAGHKNEVEDARSTVVKLGARSPLQTWDEWNGRFNREIDTVTGTADNFTIFPSFFLPSNALEEGAWKPFKLSEQEVNALLNEAPMELRARFAADSAVASLTFEFSSAAILRPWFVSEALQARFWRFADASKIISDGGTPPKGACPAYVTAIVFARKVAVEKKQTMEGQRDPKPFDGFRFTVAVRDQERLMHIQPEASMETHPLHVERTEKVVLRMMKMNHATAVSPMAANMRVENVATMRGAIVNDAVARPRIAQEVSVRPLRDFRAVQFRRKLEGVSIQTTPAVAPPPLPPQSPQPTIQDEAIYILAFICKALPKCPNPDLTLQW